MSPNKQENRETPAEESYREDVTLVRGVVSGDLVAWEQFVRAFSGHVNTICVSFVGETYAQELFLGYFEELQRSNFRVLKGYRKTKGTLITYLICTCHNYCIKRIFSEFIMRPEMQEDLWNILDGFYKSRLLKTIKATIQVKSIELSPYDLYHDLLVHLFEDNCRRLKQFSGQGSFSNWLKRVATNFVIDKARKIQRCPMVAFPEDKGGDETKVTGDIDGRLPMDLNPPPDQEMKDIEESALRESRISRMKQVIQELSERSQLYLRLRYWEEQKASEVAEIMGESVDRVYKIAEKNMRKLRDKTIIQPPGGKTRRGRPI